jgi:long-chain acyl-CoA synthetase
MSRNYPHYNVIEYNTIPQMVEAFKGANGKYGPAKALVFYDNHGNEYTYSYLRLNNDVSAFANGLIAMGLSGKHIAIASENRYEWLVAFLAIACCGGVAICLDVEQRSEVIWDMIDKGDGQVVVCSPLLAEHLGENRLPFICFTGNGQIPGECTFYGDLIDRGLAFEAENPSALDSIPIEKDTPAAIFYTSGTTSSSKPVVLSHYNIMYNACHAQQLVTLGESMFTTLPFYHTYSLVAGILDMLSQGGVVGANGSFKYIFRDILLFKPVTLFAVPLLVDTIARYIRNGEEKKGLDKKADAAVAHYRKLLRIFRNPRTMDHPGVKEVLGESVKIIISGGAHLSEETAMRLSAYGLLVIQGYGITECSPLISVNRNEFNKIGSVGKVMPGMQVRIEDGEICVKGPSVSRGYYKNEKFTAQAFRDGWFMTGDIGYLDKDGFLYINGRKKSLIVFSNGKKISPEEIEIKLMECPYVKEVVAYGASSGQSADDVKLAVIVYPDPDRTVGMQPYEVLHSIQKEVERMNMGQPPFRKIQIVKLTETPFERTSTKKIKREGIVQ